MFVDHMFIIGSHFVLLWHTLDVIIVRVVNIDKGTKGRVSKLLSEAPRLYPSSFSTASNSAVNSRKGKVCCCT